MRSDDTRFSTRSQSEPTDGRLYIVSDNEASSFLAAQDARNGTELWRVARDEKSSWSSPFVWQNALRTEIITTATKKVRSYDTSGKLLWEIAGLTAIHAPTLFSAGGLPQISAGYPTDPVRPAYAIRPGANGDIRAAKAVSDFERDGGKAGGSSSHRAPVRRRGVFRQPAHAGH